MKRLLLQIYASNKAEAFDFYKHAFNAELDYSEVTPDGTVIHAELDICGQSIAVGTLYHKPDEAVSGNTMQFCLQFDEDERYIITHAYEAMKDSGTVLTPLGSSFFSAYMTDIIDKYGVHWCLFV